MIKRCLLAIIALSANLYGCADDQARQQIADTNQRLSQLQQDVSVINNKLANQKTLDTLNQVDNLQTQINQLNGRLSDLDQVKANSGNDLNQQLQSLDMRISALESLENKSPKQESPAPVGTSSSPSNAHMLELAVTKIKNNKIQSAIVDLKQIINGNDAVSAKEAYYYLSVAYIADNRYNDAITYANKFISISPKSKNVPDAMRVVYIAQIQLNDDNAATTTAKKLLKMYPNSNAARKVAKQLH